MNRDVKIGLAIGLLLLVGLFVWFAWRQSTRPAVDGIAQSGAPGPDKTSSGPGSPDAGAGQYLPGDCNTVATGTGADTARVTMGTPTDTARAKSDLTPEGMRYRETVNNIPPTGGPAVVTPPTPLTPPANSFAGAPTSYVVKPGDTLSIISRKVYGSARFWQKIAEANNIADARTVRDGQTLKIPALSDSERGRVSGAAVASTGMVAPAGNGQSHKVVSGDTLEGISKKYYGTIKHADLIKQANRLDNERMLRVGSTLVIPALSAPAAPSTPTPATTSVATVPTSVATSARREYVVQEGDTLHMISRKFYGTTKYYLLIMQANNLEDTRAMRIGAKLVIPPRPDVSAAVPVAATTTETVAMESSMAPGERRYTVREGDSFAIIAATELGSSLYSADVMKRNKLTEADNLRPGQVLVIPAKDTLHVLSSVTE